MKALMVENEINQAKYHRHPLSFSYRILFKKFISDKFQQWHISMLEMSQLFVHHFWTQHFSKEKSFNGLVCN